MTATTTLTVRVLHRTSRPNCRWCEPVGWVPGVPDFAGEDWTLDAGSLWGEHEEEAGLAVVTDAAEGDEIEVVLSDLWWMGTGDCRGLGAVRLPKEGE